MKSSQTAALLQQVSHRRFNPLAREWVLVSPHRSERPWLGQIAKPSATAVPVYDPSCYLCPGNSRAGAARNPDYAAVFVFDNDYPALLPDATDAAAARPGTTLSRAG